MIVFGTDGWRGLIARDFTFENLQYVALATAKFVKKNFKDLPTVIVGYDTRFLSREFAQEVACVLAWQGVSVHLAEEITSTPQVSFNTKQKDASIGIIITASHNPAVYNGYKMKANFGGPATPEQIAMLEKELKVIMKKPPVFKQNTLDFYLKNQKIRMFDAKEPYLRYIKKKIKINTIKESGLKILFDLMYGAGINTVKELLPDADEIHSIHNPGFGDLHHPEPIAENLQVAIDLVKSKKYDVCLAFDGDADRLGCIDHEGNFVDSHRIFMIFMRYLYEKKKKRGAVAKTVSLTSMVNKYCSDNKIELFETAVGFKHIAKLMVERDILIGGEESGGLSTILHIPERDGLFNGLLLLEIMASEKKSLKQLNDELDNEFGIHRFQRRDVRVTQAQKDAILAACAKKPKKLGKYNVRDINTTDGYKFFVDYGWLLIRASGTEPLIRFYSEADSLNRVEELLDEGLKLAK
jgi:phosphomannomutase